MKAEAAIQPKSRQVKAENRVPRWVMPMIKTAVFTADAAIVVLSFIVAFKLRQGGAVLSATAWAWSPDFVPNSVRYLTRPGLSFTVSE